MTFSKQVWDEEAKRKSLCHDFQPRIYFLLFNACHLQMIICWGIIHWRIIHWVIIHWGIIHLRITSIHDDVTFSQTSGHYSALLTLKPSYFLKWSMKSRKFYKFLKGNEDKKDTLSLCLSLSVTLSLCLSLCLSLSLSLSLSKLFGEVKWNLITWEQYAYQNWIEWSLKRQLYYFSRLSDE